MIDRWCLFLKLIENQFRGCFSQFSSKWLNSERKRLLFLRDSGSVSDCESSNQSVCQKTGWHYMIPLFILIVTWLFAGRKGTNFWENPMCIFWLMNRKLLLRTDHTWCVSFSHLSPQINTLTLCVVDFCLSWTLQVTKVYLPCSPVSRECMWVTHSYAEDVKWEAKSIF
jgi:hypothetical protein